MQPCGISVSCYALSARMCTSAFGEDYVPTLEKTKDLEKPQGLNGELAREPAKRPSATLNKVFIGDCSWDLRQKFKLASGKT